MGHDAHFLSRLTRLDDPRTLDLALGLYRDRRAVRLILELNPRIGDAERIALALDPPPRSAHIIVARDGGFITCLAPGMKVSDRVVLTRAEVDRALEHSAALGRADTRIKWQGGLLALLGKVVSNGHRVAREDFDAVYTLAPALLDLLEELMGRGVDLHATIVDEVPADDLAGAFDPELHALLSHYGNAGATLDQTVLLALPSAQSARDLLDAADSGVLLPTRMLAATADLTTAARVATVAAQLGEASLGYYTREWREARSLNFAFEPFVALVALARQRPRMRRKILGILGDTPPSASALLGAMPAVRAALDDPEAAEARLWDQARVALAEHGVDAPDAAVIDAVIGARNASLFNGETLRRTLPAVAVWAARRSPMDYFVPAATLDALPDRVLPRRIPIPGVRRRLLALHAHYAREARLREQARILSGKRPPAAGPKVGRNAPCPCGSGLKHKRCCLRKR